MNGSVSLRDRLNVTVRDIPRSGIRDFFDIVTTMKDVISLGIGEPDFDTPWHVRESTVFAHGVPLAVETRAENGFRLTRAMLEAKVTPRTKVLMLNFPNNPTGAVMLPADLAAIAAFARER